MKTGKKTAALFTAFWLSIGSVQAAPPDLSLEDLGISPSQAGGDPAQQARLEERSRDLKVHQTLGLITAVPMVAALMTGEKAGVEEGSKSGRDLHMGLGIAAGALYFTTAYFAIHAPRIEGRKKSGATQVHRALAFIHFPAMVMAPILGYQAKKKADKGESPTGLAKHHSDFAGTAAAAFLASLAVVTIRF